jgi:predicted nucleic acid-binding protein
MSRSTRPSQEEPPRLPARIVLDACVLLNLHATGRVGEILSALPCRFLVSSYVAAEALWYCAPLEKAGDLAVRRPILLEPLIQSGAIEIVELVPEELEVFLTFARELGDGEAASGAIAANRAGVVATDDRKARSRYCQCDPPVGSIGTPSLLRAWEGLARIETSEMRAILRVIRVGAKFQPSVNDESSDWWLRRLDSAAPVEPLVLE